MAFMLFGKKDAEPLLGIKVIRSHRRTMSLEITKNGEVVIRAPYLFPERKIAHFVNEKENWIKNKQAIIKKRVAEKPKRQFLSGEIFLFLGKPYPLLIAERKRPALILSGCFELAEAKRKKASIVFTEWYKKQTLEVVGALVRQYAVQYGLNFKKIKVTGAKTRWGSCSSLGNLSFSWRLVMAPKEIIVYVVVHELAHLIHHNHGKKFWRFVEKMDKNYRQNRRWLKENGHKLVLD